ncbi:MAG: site-2 protease family protein [Pseudomonadota bacterium]
MGGSVKLFEVAGTSVRIHPTFFLLLAWIAAIHWMKGGPQEAVAGVVFIAILFLCVVLHEFGHIFMARRFGIKTPDVTLLPIGGVAALERMPEKPGEEIAVALAGPAVNLVIAALLIAIAGLPTDAEALVRAAEGEASLVQRVAVANIALFAFNLIPAFPMDGGRVLRALLAIPMGFTRATRAAAVVGQGLAIVLGFLGLFGNPFLILIAVFIFFAASGEAGYVLARDLTRGYLAAHAMITRFEALSPLDTIDDAADLLLRTTQQELPVVDGGGRLRGVLIRADIVRALREQGGATPVVEVMTRDIVEVRETAPLDGVMAEIAKQRSGIVGVVDGAGRLTGYVSSENLYELMSIREARALQGR